MREGGTVCEVGAGDGALSIAAARGVGPTGRVYTSELGEKSAPSTLVIPSHALLDHWQ